MMEKWWEALSSSPEASHVISFLDSQTQKEMIKQSRTETKKSCNRSGEPCRARTEVSVPWLCADKISGRYSEPLFLL